MQVPPDFTEAGEIYRKSMEEALAHLDILSEEVTKAKEKAIDQEIAARDELLRIQRDAEKLSEEFIQQHRQQYDARVRNDTMMEVVEKLVGAGRSSGEIKLWLEVGDEIIAHAHTYLHFEKLGERMAKVIYDVLGRGGNVYLNWDGLILKFPYEFDSGIASANMNVPDPEHWVARTTIPVEQRKMVLEFIAKQFVRDLAPNHSFEITADYIHVYDDTPKQSTDE